MIAFVYGTTAELIKIAPVYQRIVAAGGRPLLWSTGQHAEELPTTTARLHLPEPDFVLANGFHGHSLSRTTDVPVWMADIARNAMGHRSELERALWADDRPPIVLVHGDTMTTVVGAVLGRWLGVTVGHIEAGLRTNKILEPFPEELDRRVAARLAHVHYTPGIDKFLNLRGVGGIKIDTVANTVLDAVLAVPIDDSDVIAGIEVPERFGLVSLHRFELLQKPARLEAILAALHAHGEQVPMLVVTDSQASAQVESLGLGHFFDGERLIRLEKLPYFDFVSLLRRAEFVVTDSGGLQEECAYLNIPCLVHRNTTERTEGLGTNVVMSMYDIDVVKRFLAAPERHRSTEPPDFPSPSDLIVDHLARAGHCPTPDARPLHGNELSVVVPAFQQAELIRSTLQSAIRALDQMEIDYEIVVLTDAADATTYEISQVDSDRVRVLTYADNAGQARGFKYAFAQTRGKVVAYADPTVLMTADNLVSAVRQLLDSGADVVAGSKVHEGSDVSSSRLRQLQTEAFSSLVTRLVGVPVRDAHLGLKVFRRDVLEAVLPFARSGGFGFDIELLATAHEAGYQIEECPVSIPGRMKTIINPFWLVRAAAGSLRLVVLRYQLSRYNGERTTVRDA